MCAQDRNSDYPTPVQVAQTLRGLRANAGFSGLNPVEQEFLANAVSLIEGQEKELEKLRGTLDSVGEYLASSDKRGDHHVAMRIEEARRDD